MCGDLMETATFYLEFGSLGSSEFEAAGRVLMYIVDQMKQYGDKELSEQIVDRFEALLHVASGAYDSEGRDSLSVAS